MMALPTGIAVEHAPDVPEFFWRRILAWVKGLFRPTQRDPRDVQIDQIEQALIRAIADLNRRRPVVTK